VIARTLTILLALLVASCVAPPPTDVSVRTYDVMGTTMSALERSLATHGPAVPGLPGRAFAAVETRFMHNFEPEQAGASCRYGRDGRVGIRSEVILPEWRQRDTAPPELREKWDLISRYAVIHEAGHIRISQKYARILEQAYRNASASTCAGLEQRMEELIAPIAADHVAEQRRFDETDLPRFRAFLRRYGYTVGI
jgi:predicted secreted Zn-dependent protease